MPEPGWIPRGSQRPGSHECHRLAFSCATGVHPRRLRFIDPCDESNDFWGEWARLARERGWVVKLFTRAEAERSGRFWIATVDSFTLPGRLHSVVMLGRRLYYDPAVRKRVRAPTKLRGNPEVPFRLGEL